LTSEKFGRDFFGLFFLAFEVVTKAERYSLLKIFKEIKEKGGQNLEREIADGFTKKSPFTYF